MQKLRKILSSNYEFLLSIILLVGILLVCIAPDKYINSTFAGFVVWAKIVLPSLFVFFILTKLFVEIRSSQRLFAPMDKLFFKVYNINGYGGYIFAMSIIAGYPIGAKITSELCQNGFIKKDEAKKIISFASTSGPMFIVGSVATKMFNNNLLGLTIMLSHVVATLINGLIYTRRKDISDTKTTLILPKRTSYSLNDIMYNSIISILMVGGYIALCFACVEMLGSIILPIKHLLPSSNFVSTIGCVLKGIIEVTTGCISLTTLSIDTKLLCVILTGIITFGGLSIHMQSQLFLNKIGIKYKYFLLTKFTQTIISIIVSTILAFILL